MPYRFECTEKEYKSPNETIQVAIDYVKKIKSTENLVDSYIDSLTTKKRKEEGRKGKQEIARMCEGKQRKA